MWSSAAAMGHARTISAEMIREGAIIVAVGVNQVTDPHTGQARLVGDVHFDQISPIAAAITPVPGAQGP